MKIEIILISLLLVQSVVADVKVGKPVTCAQGQTDCKSCPQMNYFNWVYDSTTQQCHIEDCNVSTIINFSDQYCLSCQSDDSNTYSNYSSCVKSTDSCYYQRTTAWTDSDCQICGRGQYAIFNGQLCSYQQCNNQQTWTDQDCQNCNWSYVASPDQTKCVNTNGISCTQIPQGQMISDQYCQACLSSNYYADVFLQKCVQSSDNCGIYNSPSGTYYYSQYNNREQRKTPWTDDDCKICSSQFATSDKSGCFSCQQTAQQNQYSDQICQKCVGNGYFATIDGAACVQSSDTCGKNYPQTGTISQNRVKPWTDDDCKLCKEGQYAFQHQQGCFSCPSSSSSGTGLYYSDDICQKCFGKQYFATQDGSSCVQSTDSCGRGQIRFNFWTDSDCQLCKVGQYASQSQNSCFSCLGQENAFPSSISYYQTDEICQKCQGQGYFATIDGSSCVKSQFTCGRNSQRLNSWTDSDCQLCKVGQYAYQHQSYIYGPSGNGCYSCQLSYFGATYYNDEVCQKCLGQGYYATPDGQQCVQSQDSCGNNYQKQRLTPWTDSDCKLCKSGMYAYANKLGCFFCSQNSVNYNYPINTQYNDEICLKCFGKGYFATVDRTSCVQSSDSCEVISNNINQVSFESVRLSPWTDQDCQLCKAGQQALPDKLGCYTCPSQQQMIEVNDQICQLCLGSGYYATYNGQSCVKSSDTCGNNSIQTNPTYQKYFLPNRQSPWTNEDCQLCQLGQYATLNKNSCFSCNYNNPSGTTSGMPYQQQTDYMCQTCIGQGYFVSAQGICVKSSDNCQIHLTVNNIDLKSLSVSFVNLEYIQPQSNRKTPWTDQDCFLCQAGYYANYDKSYCSPIQCSNQKTWTDSLCQQCGINYQLNNSTYTIRYYASVDKTSCVQTYQSCNNSTNIDDQYCQTCYKSSKVFASLDGKKCLQLQDSCDSKIRKALWTDSDCQQCKKGQYATFDKKSCTKTANCSSQKPPFTDDFCQQCGSGKQYATDDESKCLNIKHSCKYTGSWSENECQLCFNNQMHANVQGTGCVKSQDSCQNRNSQWTDQDCKLCYPQKNITINLLGTDCVDIDCKKTSGWTDYECYKCNPLKPIASSNKSSCQQQK
ncbi:hypothetical protein ABPG74_005946 [Tetrahymena malaccensis]